MRPTVSKLYQQVLCENVLSIFSDQNHAVFKDLKAT